MAREFNEPLTQDDLVWLRARYAKGYIDRLVETLGLADAPEPDGEPETTPDGPETGQKDDAGTKAPDGSEEAGEPAGDPGAGEDEDLIGGGEPAAPAFDILGSTESEVKTWVATASDEAKAVALETENGRQDREPRKGVVSLLS